MDVTSRVTRRPVARVVEVRDSEADSPGGARRARICDGRMFRDGVLALLHRNVHVPTYIWNLAELRYRSSELRYRQITTLQSQNLISKLWNSTSVIIGIGYNIKV